jgi:predicted acylesterase/phospholipase RssA
MFGAYQAGVWKALAGDFRPDLVVGASIGSLNGWAIAAGCEPAELERYWLDESGRLRFAFPRSFRHGILDSAAFERRVRELCRTYRPRTRYAVVLTDLLRLRPRIFESPGVTWEHLAASCAVLGCFEQRRIEGRIYSDGGLLSALPVWAAVELGATHIIAVNALPRMPSASIRALVGGLRRISGFHPIPSDPAGMIRIEPQQALGSAADLLRWDRSKVAGWIAQGERDAEAVKHSVLKCFER